MAKKPRKLNNHEKLFIAEYMLCKKPEEAALNAGYAAATARTKAYLWVSDSPNNDKPYIAEEINRRINAKAAKLGIDLDRILTEYAKIAFCNIQDFIGTDNQIVDISKLPREVAAVIESVQTSTTTTTNKKADTEYVTINVKLKLLDKLKALNDLGRHLNIFKEDNSRGDIAELISAIRDKLQGTARGLPSERHR